VKPTVRKVKDFRGRITGHKATLGPVKWSGRDPKHAANQCEQAAMLALDRLDRGAYIGKWRGHLYVVSPTIDGWAYWIDTFSATDYVVPCAAGAAREWAIDSALQHLAQNVWELDCRDDAAFVDGLPLDAAAKIMAWIGFQRRYAAEKAAGKSDVEAHRLACGG
jgi:hypothetical protein